MSVVFTVACNGVPSLTPTPASSEPSARGITVVDPRLMPAMLTIAQHPEWAPGSTTDLNAHRALTSLDELCVEVVRPNLLPLYVEVGVGSVPWTVKSIEVFDRATDQDPKTTYDSGEPDSEPDLCRYVLIGSGAPFPTEPGSVEVGGGVQDPAHARAIAQAVVAEPEAFGIDRSSRPSINLRSLGSAVEGRLCYEAVVYQGGPRSMVTITMLRDADEWRLHHVRVTRRALHSPEPVPDGAC